MTVTSAVSSVAVEVGAGDVVAVGVTAVADGVTDGLGVNVGLAVAVVVGATLGFGREPSHL